MPAPDCCVPCVRCNVQVPLQLTSDQQTALVHLVNGYKQRMSELAVAREALYKRLIPRSSTSVDSCELLNSELLNNEFLKVQVPGAGALSSSIVIHYGPLYIY